MVPGWLDSPPTHSPSFLTRQSPEGTPPVCTTVVILPVDNRGLHFCCW